MRRTLAPSETPSYAIIETVADLEGTNPVDLTPPLYAAIDPEALNDLFTSQSESTVNRITFQYAGYDVTVWGDGEFQVSSINED